MELFKSFMLGGGAVAFIFWIYWSISYPEEVRDCLLFRYWTGGATAKFVTIVVWAYLLWAAAFLGLISAAVVGRGLV